MRTNSEAHPRASELLGEASLSPPRPSWTEEGQPVLSVEKAGRQAFPSNSIANNQEKLEKHEKINYVECVNIHIYICIARERDR